jgi:pimeloyl-ACP methyl ester carboxylesterase
MSHTQETAPNLLLDVGEQHYAYRRFGTAGGVPLVLLQHFRGTMDNWDPLVTNGLAAHHDVILFDNAGVGGSSGAPAKSVSDMASHVATFVRALGLGTVDLLGFSLGGASSRSRSRSIIPPWFAASCSPAAARAADKA